MLLSHALTSLRERPTSGRSGHWASWKRSQNSDTKSPSSSTSPRAAVAAVAVADRVVEDSIVAGAAVFSEAAVTSSPAHRGRWLRIQDQERRGRTSGLYSFSLGRLSFLDHPPGYGALAWGNNWKGAKEAGFEVAKKRLAC